MVYSNHATRCFVLPDYWSEFDPGRKKNRKTNESRNARQFVALFGTTPDICLIIWNMLFDGWTKYTTNPKPLHLLWLFRFMKSYNSWDSHATEMTVDSKTFRKWIWFYLEGVSKLIPKVVSYKSFISFEYTITHTFFLL